MPDKAALPRPMTDAEGIDMMQRCMQEISSLRNQIAKLAPKAEAYDVLATVLQLLPRPGIAMGEDLKWALEKRIRELLERTKETPNA